MAAARLGASVAMIGCVGTDAFGTTLLENLKKNHIDNRGVRRDRESATGTAIIIVDTNGENSIVLSPGANARVVNKDIKPEAMAGVKLLLLQLEIPLEAVMHAARVAKEKGVRVLLNPAPAKEIPDELLKSADYLLPNETELGLLAGRKITDKASVEEAADLLVRRGASNVIVTLGEKGALIVDKSGKRQVPAYAVRPVDTTAAGDAFIGGVAFALLKSKSLQNAVKYGCACGALATTKFGAQPSLPTAQDVRDFLRSV